MKMMRCSQRDAALIAALVAVWEQSVRATHTFLSAQEIEALKPCVPEALAAVETLVVACAEDKPVGFMGVQEGRLEMLFLAPEWRGCGLGRALLEEGIRRYGVETLTVNAQNPQAVGFYTHMGFRTYRRTALDEAGRQYPLLYMRREQGAAES